jgi:uncharacterized protein (TIGR00255 family)
MISSMTGYGRAEKIMNNHLAVVEITSVNNRYLEFQIRLPRTLLALEQKIKKLLSSQLHRGKLNFSLSFEDNVQPGSRMALNDEIADMYFKIFTELKSRYNLAGDIGIKHFVGLPDLITPQTDELVLENIWNDIEPLCQDALQSFIKMREEEGKNLYDDFVKRLDLLHDHVKEIEKLSSANVIAYREKLNKRLTEILNEVPLDQQRIAMEAALMAEKMDITEEITRLGSHIDNFRQTLEQSDAIGKRLAFILQEMHREANTIASKAADFQISEHVINIKDELEKLREQSMNIE